MTTTTASPVPVAGGHDGGIVRQPVRQTVRRPGSRSQLTRTDSTDSHSHRRPRQQVPQHQPRQRYDNGTESSDDDEIFIPMKLSALTKAILNDGAPEPPHRAATPAAAAAAGPDYREGEQAPSPHRLRTRRRSLLTSGSASASASTTATTAATTMNTTTASTASGTEERRMARSRSVQAREHEREQEREREREPRQIPSSRPGSAAAKSMDGRDSSPSPIRKRIVRLSSSTPQSVSQSGIKRRSTSVSRSSSRSQRTDGGETSLPPDDERLADSVPNDDSLAVTPAPAQVRRIIRISAAAGSSGQKPRPRSSSRPRQPSPDRSGIDPDQSMMEQQQQVQADDFGNGSQHYHSFYSTGAGPSSVIRHSTVAPTAAAGKGGNRTEESAVPPSSMRVKRVGKLPGSFLSGPARRGRRRQSEEDGADEGRGSGAHEEPDGRGAREYGAEAQSCSSSFYGDGRGDFAAPESPIGRGGGGMRATGPRHGSSASTSRYYRVVGSARASPGLGEEEGKEEEGMVEPEPRELHRRLPSISSYHAGHADQENEPPLASSTARLARSAVDLILERAAATAAASAAATRQPTSPPPRSFAEGSPDRKPLSSIDQNTPHRPAPPPPPKLSILDRPPKQQQQQHNQQQQQYHQQQQQHYHQQQAPAAAAPVKKRNILKLNGKYYTRLDILGRGGSAKVYRVTSDSGEMFALKRVSLENADSTMIRGYKGEIDLLKRLAGVKRVIRLEDYEMNEERQLLSVLMEMGELDLESLMGGPRQHNSTESRFDTVFVRHYWKEMLESVQAVHEHDIVHSDLKPANFVMVRGRLKLIDFGIANAIQTDETINVHRETQVGTPNYMSPESLLDANAVGRDGGRVPGRPKLMKLGKPSDVWSLGCILYRMVYGLPPFANIANAMARCQAIVNWDHAISFPPRGTGGVAVPPSLLRTLRRCLSREPHLRPTCAELLHETDPFLYPVEMPLSPSQQQLQQQKARDGAAAADDDGHRGEGAALPVDEEMLGRIIQNIVARCRDRMPSEAEAMSVWPGAYWASVRKAMEGRQ